MVILTERVQSLQSELDQSELKREAVEAELNNAKEVRKTDNLCVDTRLLSTLQKKKKSILIHLPTKSLDVAAPLSSLKPCLCI